MPESLRLTWSPDIEGQWHKIIAYTWWGNEGPWTAHAACHQFGVRLNPTVTADVLWAPVAQAALSAAVGPQ